MGEIYKLFRIFKLKLLEWNEIQKFTFQMLPRKLSYRLQAMYIIYTPIICGQFPRIIEFLGVRAIWYTFFSSLLLNKITLWWSRIHLPARYHTFGRLNITRKGCTNIVKILLLTLFIRKMCKKKLLKNNQGRK